jgi:hypothetical protein
VDTEGFVLKAKVHSAKVMDFERGSRRYCVTRTGNFLDSLTCGWMADTVERTRARIGYRRPWDGAWISWSVPESLLPKRCSDEVGGGMGQRGREGGLGAPIAP